IAEILDQAEELRRKRREAIAQLDTLTQSIFIEMFGDPVKNPKGWKTKSLRDICDEINDCPHSTPSWTKNGVICLRTSNLTKGGWNWDDTRFVSNETYHERSKRGYILPNDIILSREGTVGIAAIVTSEIKVCMGQRLVQVRPSFSVLTSEFTLQHLLYALDPTRIGKLMVGSTSQHLNVKELRDLKIPLSPLSLQKEFTQRVEAIEELKKSHRASLSELDALFASLQHRAFRGEL
ncbi:MAG: restriction endonuclease subunit S, partial [Cuspidothrix sp.]